MKALLAALGLFTVLPAPVLRTIDRDVARSAIAAFPWLGLLLGAAGGAVLYGISLTGASPLLAAVAGLAVLAAATGALHLDGVADTADGLGSRKPAQEALAIMRRSDIGPMGVVTLLFVVLFDVTALASLSPATAWAGFALAAMVGRAAIVLATVAQDSARTQGFGALFIGVTSPLTAAVTALAATAVAAGLGWVVAGLAGALWFAVGVLLSLAAATGWARHLRRRLGGLTGDTFGSLIELSQVLFLLVAALGLAR